MSNTQLVDLLKSKKPGDVWYSLMAPEEVRFWKIDHPWETDFFTKRKVNLQSVYVKASASSGGNDKDTWDKKHPLYLDCGVDVPKGFAGTSQSRMAGFKIRADTVADLNTALKELSDKYDFQQWEVRAIEIYNDKEGIMTEFKVHNPNCQGDALHTWRFVNGDGSRLYPDVNMQFQSRAVADFYEAYTHCTMIEKTISEKDCAKKRRIRGKQIKLVKKNK